MKSIKAIGIGGVLEVVIHREPRTTERTDVILLSGMFDYFAAVRLGADVPVRRYLYDQFQRSDDLYAPEQICIQYLMNDPRVPTIISDETLVKFLKETIINSPESDAEFISKLKTLRGDTKTSAFSKSEERAISRIFTNLGRSVSSFAVNSTRALSRDEKTKEALRRGELSSRAVVRRKLDATVLAFVSPIRKSASKIARQFLGFDLNIREQVGRARDTFLSELKTCGVSI